MAVVSLTLREHLSGIPDARIVPPAMRDEDLGSFVSAESEAAVDASLVEARAFEAIPIRESNISGFTHFLDGVQRSWRVGFVGMSPLYLAYTAAGLLARVDRDVLPPDPEWHSGELELALPEDVAMPAIPGLPLLRVGTGMDDTETTVRQRIANAISARREERETEIARQFRNGVLLIDGGIGRALERVPEGVQMVGVVKSHQRQYFASKERIRTILDLKPGERTPVFLRERNMQQGKEANSFYLRLFDSSGQGPLFGLIRVEVPTSAAFLEQVDEICSWLLAERDPLSLPDARYDRMLYPIRLVEKHLKARQPSDSAIRGITG
jgi:hypothetical protein